MIELFLFSLLFIGPIIYAYGHYLEKKDKVDRYDELLDKEAQVAYYCIPGLEGSDIHESLLEELK